MATAYPYFLSFEKLPDIFTRIRSAGVPKKFTFRFFARLGFTSSNDRGFVTLLRLTGFIDERGIPTALYLRLRDTNDYKNVLKEQIKLVYKELFEVDTHIDNKPLLLAKNVFSNLTGESDKNTMIYAQTFKALCMVAGYSNEPLSVKEPLIVSNLPQIKSNTSKVNYNININLPDTTDPSVFEAIFKSIKDCFQ